MWITVVIVFHALGIILSINAVMTARTSQGAIAWVVSLNTFPDATVPACWMLGRSRFPGYVVARRSEDADGTACVDGCEKLIAELIDLDDAHIVENLSKHRYQPETEC